MSTRYNNGSHYENHPAAQEVRELAAHTHEVGEQHGKQDHLTGQEHTRQAEEHSAESQGQAQVPTTGHGIAAFGHEEIKALANTLWVARGCPQGSPETDWYQAVKQLRFRGYGH